MSAHVGHVCLHTHVKCVCLHTCTVWTVCRAARPVSAKRGSWLRKRAVKLRAEQPELSLAAADARREVGFSAAGANHLTAMRCYWYVPKLLEDSQFPKRIMILFTLPNATKNTKVILDFKRTLSLTAKKYLIKIEIIKF